MRVQTLTLATILLALTACKFEEAPDSVLTSGGGSNPAQLGCEGLQANFVDDGNKLEETIARYNTLLVEFDSNATAQATPDANSAEPGAQSIDEQVAAADPTDQGAADDYGLSLAAADDWQGMQKATPYTGEISPILDGIKIPEGITNEAACTKYSGKQPAGLYDSCTEIVVYYKRLKAIADVWDNNGNAKKCYEGKSFETVQNPEFGYCDNECAFNDETCYQCTVTYNTSRTESFVCKSIATATDAIGAFCRNSGVSCTQYEPQDVCKAGKGRDFATTTGVQQSTFGGGSELETAGEISAYLGATEKVEVKAGVAAGQEASIRGTVTGRVGYRRSQGVGSMFTPTGLGVNGLSVECFIEVSGVGSISYGATFGVGGDFVIASGEATVDVGGSISLSETYRKTSPSFSGAGQSNQAIKTQCINNYIKGWLGSELDSFIANNNALKVIKKGVDKLMSELNLDQNYEYTLSKVACHYPGTNESGKGNTTSSLHLYPTADGLQAIWEDYRHFGFDALAEDLDSPRVTLDEANFRPFLRHIKDQTMTNSRLIEFMNKVVAPASSNQGKWRFTRCFATN